MPRISSQKPNRQFQREYVEHVSGGKGKEQRPQFAAMLDDAHRRQFDIVLCWALDRFSREGMVPTIGHLQRLDRTLPGFERKPLI